MAAKKETGQQEMNLDELKLNTAELAALFGYSERRIQTLTKEGILEKKKYPKIRGGRYLAKETTQRYIKYLSDKIKNKAVTQSEAKLKTDKLKAEAELKESQTELHKLKTDIFKGKYVPVEEVELDYKKFFAILKRFAEAIPARVTMLIGQKMEPADLRKIEKEISAEIRDMLRKFTVSAAEEDSDDEDNPI